MSEEKIDMKAWYEEADQWIREEVAKNRTLESVGSELSGVGLPWRVTEVDGKPCLVTRDYVGTRFNLSVQNGIVVAMDRG